MLKSTAIRFTLWLTAFGCFTPSIYAQQGKTANVNGIQLYYEIHGKGDPLVLLHNFGSSGKVWEPYVSDLAKSYRVIVVDMRGHGRSTNPTNQFTHRQSALDIFALLDQLNINQFKAMGISSGAMTLLHMATQQPKRVEAIALIGGTTYFGKEARTILQGSSPDNMTEEDYKLRRPYAAFGDGQIKSLQTQFYNFKDSYDDMNFTPPYLSTITAKTLIIHGDRDRFFPIEIAVEMYRSIPNSYLWIFPNGGHIPIHKRPEVFKVWALEFLRGDWEKK